MPAVSHNKKRRRPPDVLYSFSSPYGLMAGKEKDPLSEALGTAIFLSGRKLQMRTMKFCSGSRTSKKR